MVESLYMEDIRKNDYWGYLESIIEHGPTVFIRIFVCLFDRASRENGWTWKALDFDDILYGNSLRP